MEIKIFETANQAAEFTAQEMVNTLKKVENAKFGLATGRTMDAVYLHLLHLARNLKLDFSKATAFAVDEYVGLARDSENSYKAYLNMHVFDHLNFKKENINLPQVHESDLDLACTNYENLIQSCGGIDLQLLGIGRNGHIGLNEPGSAADSLTRLVALTTSTMNSNKVLFKNEGMPLTAITMGIGTILTSKKCLLLATGESKAEIIQKTINGDVNSKVPATALKEHKNVIIVLDKDAAKLI